MNLFGRQGNCKVRGKRSQFAASRLDRGRDLLFCRLNDATSVFLCSRFDPRFFRGALLFRNSAHLADLLVETSQPRLDIRQAAVRILTGAPRFFNGLLNRCSAVAEDSWQDLLRKPGNRTSYNREIDDDG